MNTICQSLCLRFWNLADYGLQIRKAVMLQFFLMLACAPTIAQQLQAEDEIKQNPYLSASNNVAYPVPTQKLTPPPSGKKAFYLSHYGRHGSRFLTKTRDYEYAQEVLVKGQKNGKLSALGQDVLRRVQRLCDEAHDRWGDLTPLGAQQEREIVDRMMKNFPEVFKKNACIEVRSTMIARCLLSMTHSIAQMTANNPKLHINFDASYHEMYYMNLQDKALITNASNAATLKAYDDFCQRHQCWERMVNSLFNDAAYVRDSVNGERLNYYLFRLAGSIQNTKQRNELTLFDLFTPEELVENWRMENVYWYLGFGFNPLSGSKQPYTQRNLLRKIIEQADSCIQLPTPGAHLRFGHETMVLPLTCLMGLNGYDAEHTDLEQLDKRGWVNYRVYPMGCNLQLIFYRKNVHDKDVLVKVLLNEREATLPLKSDLAPYYRWNEVRQYYLNKLNAYEQNR